MPKSETRDNNKESLSVTHSQLKRREFLKTSAKLGAMASVAGFTYIQSKTFICK